MRIQYSESTKNDGHKTLQADHSPPTLVEFMSPPGLDIKETQYRFAVGSGAEWPADDAKLFPPWGPPHDEGASPMYVVPKGVVSIHGLRGGALSHSFVSTMLQQSRVDPLADFCVRGEMILVFSEYPEAVAAHFARWAWGQGVAGYGGHPLPPGLVSF
jgi:hypothetical protein